MAPLTAVAVAAAYTAFAVSYPSSDGDTIKGTYLLTALPAAALGAAIVVDVLRLGGGRWALAMVGALALSSWSSCRS